MKLSEGEIHHFHVVKSVNIPEEGDYFVLRHESGRRIMLSAHTYRYYNIEPSKKITCKIDKVNCSGKVYLEPQHPKYQEDKYYDFEAIACKKKNNNDQKSYNLVVRDCFGNQINVSVSEFINISKQKLITLRVIRIKKGIPILIHPTLTEHPCEPSGLIDTKLLFTIKGIVKNVDNEDVFSLTNDLGYRSELKVKHYASYGLSIRKEIECTVYSINQDGFLKVEPINPYYEIGNSYDFTISSKENDNMETNSEKSILVVEDITGKKCGVELESKLFLKLKQKPSIKCRVVGFRRGRPKLELL